MRCRDLVGVGCGMWGAQILVRHVQGRLSTWCTITPVPNVLIILIVIYIFLSRVLRTRRVCDFVSFVTLSQELNTAYGKFKVFESTEKSHLD